MFQVEIITGFAAAHRLREYKGKCEHLHGHNYRVHVRVRSEALGAGGMIIDFGDLKKMTAGIIETLDHAYLNDIPPFDRLEPSAENLAAHIFEQIDRELSDCGANGVLHSVSIWESDTAVATFFRNQ
jgi:6-pyruvoyltetrahydropterin/6-carboxytetrahydropterin synthase